jgi:hypothetical protein
MPELELSAKEEELELLPASSRDELLVTAEELLGATPELLGGSLDEEGSVELLLSSEDDELPFGTTLELLGSLDEEKSTALESISSSLGNLSGG